MQNVHEILKKYGVEIPAESKADFDKDVAANYKTIAEHETAMKLSNEFHCCFFYRL